MSPFGIHCEEWKKTGALPQRSLPAHSTVEHTDTGLRKGIIEQEGLNGGREDKKQGRGGSMGKITKDLSKKSNGNQIL